MPLLYQPSPAHVVVCNFTGFVIPEMVKTRPVVVIAKHKHNSKLVTVVPLSTTEPIPLEAHHHELATCPLPGKAETRMWAKCDMVYTVSVDRLDRYKIKCNGVRQYIVPKLADSDYLSIRQCVLVALGY